MPQLSNRKRHQTAVHRDAKRSPRTLQLCAIEDYGRLSAHRKTVFQSHHQSTPPQNIFNHLPPPLKVSGPPPEIVFPKTTTGMGNSSRYAPSTADTGAP